MDGQSSCNFPSFQLGLYPTKGDELINELICKSCVHDNRKSRRLSNSKILSHVLCDQWTIPIVFQDYISTITIRLIYLIQTRFHSICHVIFGRDVTFRAPQHAHYVYMTLSLVAVKYVYFKKVKLVAFVDTVFSITCIGNIAYQAPLRHDLDCCTGLIDKQYNEKYFEFSLLLSFSLFFLMTLSK